MNSFKQKTAHKLYSFAMNCGQSLRFACFTLTLLLVIQQDASAQTFGMYDVPVGADFKPKRTLVIHKRVRFVFENAISIISPEEGQPTVAVSGTIFEKNYTTGGKKKITFRQSGSTTDHVFEITVKEPTTGGSYKSPDEIWTVSTSETYTPTACEAAAYPVASERPVTGNASAYILYGAGHNGKLVRPIIFVDGIDFDQTEYTDPDKGNQVIRHGKTGWDIFMMGLEEKEIDEPENGVPDYEVFGYYPTAFKDVTALSTQNASTGNDSYDLIFIDFSNGTDYIQRNSLLLIELIKRVNAAKVADAGGNVHKNVVLGASMGGQVARIALAMMEQRGENHCTHTYVSFDSPHKGANIPLSVQAMGWFLGMPLR